ncbi:RNA-directed DNA polymerase, partial [Blautia wexlerae]|nr:RNA-directed DNA polymerase [Blautia wexlerae]
FKSEFQLRPETRQLKKLLRELVRQYLNFDFHVTFELTDVKLYTNVYMIRKILSDILHDMAQRKQFPDILVRVEDLGSDYVDIILCQKDSDYYATHLQLIQETESGDFCELKRKMANLCDWYVETQCKDGAFRINYLDSIQPDRTIAEPLLSDGVKGFTHRIRIYKHYAYENPNYR